MADPSSPPPPSRLSPGTGTGAAGPGPAAGDGEPAARRASDALSPTRRLEEDHALILRAVAVLERLGSALGASGPVDRGALAWLVDFFRGFVDGCHHAKEERYLFPLLESRGLPREGGPTGAMRYEHEVGRELLRIMAEGGDGLVVAAIGRYTALLRIHIDKEGGVLFRLAEHLISPEEAGGLVAQFDELERAVGGPGFRDRLAAELLRLEAAAR